MTTVTRRLRKARSLSSEHREKISVAMRGNTNGRGHRPCGSLSLEHRAAIGVTLMGNTNGRGPHTLKDSRGPLSLEHKKAIGAGLIGHRVESKTRAKISAANMGKNLGRVASSETRAKMAEATARQEPTWGPTGIHYDLANFLADAGLRVALEVPFGRARVDIYLLDHHLAVEADGRYHHERVERDRPGYYDRRDAELLRRFGLPVARFTEAEIEELTV